MAPYEHRAKYYETDQMGIIHHSNYIRWMEEARLDFMDQLGWGYRAMEESGMMSPVLAVSCEYKGMVRFDDTVCITVKVKEYKGVRLTLSYRIIDKNSGEIRAVGESRHCFSNREGRPVSLKKYLPEFDALLHSQSLV
jgi:acyl-CoA thioester hydrolase